MLPLAVTAHVLYRKTVGNYLIFHSGNDAQIHDMLENLYIEYLGHAKYSCTFLNSMLVMFWAMLLRYHENDIESILTKDTAGNSVTEILNYLNQHYQTVTLSKLALAFNYSERQVIRIFKKNTGKGFSELLTEIRMNKAIQLLKNKDIPINGIASLLGYSSTYYFNKVFLETFTFSPESFRKRIFQT